MLASPATSKSVPFGNPDPWAEPSWYNALASPYYNDTHKRLRDHVRAYIDERILPNAAEWERRGEVDRDAVRHYITESGLAFVDVPVQYRPAHLRTVAGIPVDKLDAFHMLVLTDEVSRFEGGIGISLSNGANAIGVPPIINHGSEEQKRRWLPGLFDLSTSFCLGITEASGGSDVSNIKITAIRQGNEYVVNGTKKWITGAPWSSHMTTAVRTGGSGIGGISMLVIPLKSAGVTIRKIENSGQNGGGASWVSLDDVRVPADHLLGKENAGFKYIMTNFNKERYIMSVSCNRKSRTCLSLAYAYALERETFGKPLIANQIIRHKITTLAREIESHWAWLEQIAYHIQQHGWQDPSIASRIALLKIMGGRMLELAAREAQQVMGGISYQRDGPHGGGRVEQITRDLRMMVVGGGSEEILGDLAFREEVKRSGLLAGATKL